MGTACILIADDHATWVDSMARLLEVEGYRILRARTGVDALYQARMRRPDLVLLDPDLPQLSGWEVSRRLRQSPDLGNVKVVLLTLQGGGRLSGGSRPSPRSGSSSTRLKGSCGISSTVAPRPPEGNSAGDVPENSFVCHPTVTVAADTPVVLAGTAGKASPGMKPLLDAVLFLAWVSVYLAAVFWIGRYRRAKAHALGPTGRTDYRADKDAGLQLALFIVGAVLVVLVYGVIRIITPYF